jgi:hypothetical protein
MGMQSYPVAFFNRGEKEFNTLALAGMEIVIPLEEDLDCDPLQDDEIRLQSVTGEFERVVLASDPEAKPNHEERLIYYHFAGVPPGIYRLSVRIAGSWVDITNELIVTPKGAHLGDKKLGEKAPSVQFDSRQVREEGPRPRSRIGARKLLPRRYMDQNPNRWDQGAE